MTKHMLTLICYNFVHLFLFFLIPFQIITKVVDADGFFNFTLFCFFVSCWSMIQGMFYIKILKTYFPKTFVQIMKDVENV